MVGARAEVACSGKSTADRDGDQVATWRRRSSDVRWGRPGLKVTVRCGKAVCVFGLRMEGPEETRPWSSAAAVSSAGYGVHVPAYTPANMGKQGTHEYL